MKYKTYLIGPIGDVGIGDAREWRDMITDELEKIGIEALNPLGKYGDRLASVRSKLSNWNRFGNLNAIRGLVKDRIIPPDLKMVEKSNFVTFWLPAKGPEICGSFGEITLAFYLGKPVYIITRRRLKPVNIPNWAIGCSTKIFKDWCSYLNFIKEKYI